MAIHLMCAAKNGISSHELARQLDITQKSAWFVCHRIREAMSIEPMEGMLSGTVEVDECYIGGKPRYANQGKRGRGTTKKPVMVLVERNGNAVSFPITGPTSKVLKGAINQLCHKSSTINTDQYNSYHGVGVNFEGGHHTVNHCEKEYVRREQCGDVLVSTNTAESFFARIQRAHYGTYHQLSAKHRHRYTAEFAFRWNTRHGSDGGRFVAAINGAAGKRLMYR
jgi:transposase-like protein